MTNKWFQVSTEPISLKRCSRTLTSSYWLISPFKMCSKRIKFGNTWKWELARDQGQFFSLVQKPEFLEVGKEAFLFFDHDQSVCKLNHFYFVSVSFIHVKRAIDYSFNEIYVTKSSIMLSISSFKHRKPLTGPITKFVFVHLITIRFLPLTKIKSLLIFTKTFRTSICHWILSNLLLVTGFGKSIFFRTFFLLTRYMMRYDTISYDILIW